MKKVVSSVLAALLSVSMLSACGQSADSTSVSTAGSQTSASTGDKTTITVWSKDRHDQEFMKAIIDKLNAENDDMNVVYELYTDNYANTVDIAAGTGELPDIVCVQSQVFDTLSSYDQFYPLEDVMPEGYLDRFDADLFREGINMDNGKVVSLPNVGTTTRLVYNKDIFERVGIENPPTSVEEMVADAKLITEQLSSEGIYGFALPMKNPASGFNRGALAIAQLSGYPVAEGFDFSTGAYDFGAYIPMLDGLKEIFTSGTAFPGCESLEIDPLRTQFADGKIGMYMTYNHSEWGVYTSQFPTDEDWGYAVLPTYTGTVEGTQQLSAGTWYAITKNCKDPEKAWRVLEAFYSADNLEQYYEDGLGVSVLTSVTENAPTPASIEYLPAMAIQDTDKLWPVAPSGLVVEGDDWGTVFGAYVFGQLNDINSAVTDLNTRYDAAYKKAIADGKTEDIVYPNFKAADPVATAE